MTEMIEATPVTGTEPVPKARKKRVWTDEARAAMSRKVKARWRKQKRTEAGDNGGGAVPQAKPVASGESQPMKARLTAYGVNPNTGAVELVSQDLGESLQDLLPGLINLLYNGTVMTEIRLEQR
jgi:hypothetical protein